MARVAKWLVGGGLGLAMACYPPPRDEGLTSFGNPTSGGNTSGSTGGSGTAAGSGSAGEGADTTASDDGTGSGIKLDVGSADSGGAGEVAEVFGHSGDTLYRLDPETLAVEIVGPFAGCTASIIDIALDADSNMYGTAFGSLWSIDRNTGACTLITEEGSFTTSLSFVPVGTVDAAAEALVGFDEDQYIRIDPQTGAITPLGTLPGGLQSSGDMVSVIGGGTWLTVRGPGCEDTDCIIEIDPADGSLVRNYGSVGYDEVFGLAFWAGRAYGFARNGTPFEIEFLADTVMTTEIPIPVAPPGLEFFGAGSTTSAPPVAG